MVDIPKISKTNINGIYHYSKNWFELNNSEEYKREVLNCIAYCKPDMYFNYLYWFLVRYNFQEISEPMPSKSKFENVYLEAALKILKERCLILLSEEEQTSPSKWSTPHNNYSKYLEGYTDTILNYINYKLELYPILGLTEIDNPYTSDKSSLFIQNVMFTSFLIAYNRILSERDNEEYFGAEILTLGGRKVLNIYVTPTGMENFMKIQKWSKEELFIYFNAFIEKIGVKKINDKERQNLLNTLIILEINNELYYHFKPPLYDYSNNFIMEKLLRHHILSIKAETQVSYENLK